MSLVKGHWRRTSDGKATWVSAHYRNESGDINCGLLLLGPILAFLAPGLVCFALKEFFGVALQMPELKHCIISLVVWIVCLVLTIKLDNNVFSIITILMVLIGPALCIIGYLGLFFKLIGAIIDYFR